MQYLSPVYTRIFVWQFLCDEFYLLVYMRTFARILCGKYICRKTSLLVFMWQKKIVNYDDLFVYMNRHIFVACIYLHVCQALCDYNIALKTNFLRRVKKYVLYHLQNCQTKIAHVNGALSAMFIRNIYPQCLTAIFIRNFYPQNLSGICIRKIYPQFLSAKFIRKIYPQTRIFYETKNYGWFFSGQYHKRGNDILYNNIKLIPILNGIHALKNSEESKW